MTANLRFPDTFDVLIVGGGVAGWRPRSPYASSLVTASL